MSGRGPADHAALAAELGLAAHLPIGRPSIARGVLSDYVATGAGTVLLWALHDPLRHLELVAERVRSLIVG